MGLQSIIWIIVAVGGNNILSLLFVIVPMTAFHFGTLEEYYIGILELPPLNGVSDGSVLVIGFFLAAGILGTETMSMPVKPGEWLLVDGIKELTVG
jgi:hypothetical protein